MTTVQYLNQIDRWTKTINNKLTEIWQLRQLATNIGVTTKEDNVISSGDKDKLGCSVAKILDKESELSEYIDRVLDKKETIIFQINTIEEPIDNQVLFSRYVEQKTFDEIAEENEYSTRQIYRIHEKAISEFENIYGYLYKNA